MRVPLVDFEANIIQISHLADADLAEGCSIRYSRAQTLVPKKIINLEIINVKGFAKRVFHFRKAMKSLHKKINSIHYLLQVS